MLHASMSDLTIGIRRMLRSLLTRMEPSLISAYQWVIRPPAPNLWGDRDIEHSWIAGHIPTGPGTGLDFGSGSSHLSLVAVRRGFRMTATDRGPVRWPFEHPDFRFVQGDALRLGVAERSLDLIINCSTIEHLGLERYGDVAAPRADLDGMHHLRKLLKPDGVMLLTLPVGIDAVHPGLHRVYGKTRLPLLLQGFVIREHEFWTKNSSNRWILVDEDTALACRSSGYLYALGCFVLTSLDK